MAQVALAEKLLPPRLLGAVNREDIDNYANRAREAGGSVFAEPGESNGFMYGCGFCDPDGHRWNALFMDPSKMPT